MASASESYAAATSSGAPLAQNSSQTGVAGHENSQNEEDRLEAMENLTEEMKAKRAYVSIGRNNLEISTSGFAQKFAKENAQREIPFPVSIVKDGGAFRLGYASRLERDGAVRHGVIIDGIRVEVEPPTPPRTTYSQAIYIFGVPEEETDARVAAYLRKSGLKPMSDFRKLFIPNTVIPGFRPNGFWGGGRSVIVEAEIGTEIPGFARYTSPTLKSAPKINIWYPRMGEWCRTCFESGHRAFMCPRKMRKVADEFEELTEWKELMKKLATEYEDNIEPFFTKESPFSNHHLCEIEVDEVAYKSTEHCLFTQRALFCKDATAADEIKNADTAAKAMKRGRKVPFPGGIEAWHKFAKKVLEAANHAKFSQNKELRRHLFGTCGKRLVEASTDPYWGCGHSMEAMSKNVELHHSSAWRGFNVMGDILTHLRRNLMSADEYKDEANAVREEVFDRRNAKRPRESPPSNPSEAKKACERTVSGNSVASEF